MTPATMRIGSILLLPLAVLAAALTGHGAASGRLVAGLLAIAGCVGAGLGGLLGARRWRAGAILLDLGPAPTRQRDGQWAAYWAGASALVLALGYPWPWLLFTAGQAAYYTALATQRVQVRARGLTGIGGGAGQDWGYLPWARIDSYRLTGAALVLSYAGRHGRAGAEATLAYPAPLGPMLADALAHHISPSHRP